MGENASMPMYTNLEYHEDTSTMGELNVVLGFFFIRLWHCEGYR